MNPVLILSYNGLPYLQHCMEAVRKQDIPTSLYVIDNGSEDGSREWLLQEGIPGYHNDKNLGVSVGWNQGLEYLFGDGAQYVLVLNQDVSLPTYFYRELLDCNVPLVTGFPVDNLIEISPLTASPMASKKRRAVPLDPHPCFSAFLIRRECWEAVGKFEESMFAWAGDCDYHVRAHRKGVGMWKSMVPFFHHAGTTTRIASDAEREWFMKRANEDREVFRGKYGVIPGDSRYSDLFAESLFGTE